MSIEDDIAKEIAGEAEAEAASGKSWKRIAAESAWKFSREKGYPAFKAGVKFLYAQGKDLKNKPTKPGDKKASALRPGDVTVLGQVSESKKDPIARGQYQISFISSRGVVVETVPGNKKFGVVERRQVK
ncbi:hypothetical protein SEA_WOFFORD_159 [Streptomyces phage Wofford]|uniref:Uncharacterized protein n=1 Tax=Streptomyces phage Wofford TaxID=2283267 RepID=A0A345M9Z7_9CAUD|nr:hypothetical protein HWB78_gp137 [Streptomyces phage Wollford]AXH67318.1 hypothetical protein SEA_WOFFORD_159 [Streptomyces phage Wollford]